MALGAQRSHVLFLVLRYGVRLTAAGLAVGIAASFALRHVLAGLVFGVSTGDPLIYVSVTGLMFATALLASYLPARSATSVDPVVSLRYE